MGIPELITGCKNNEMRARDILYRTYSGKIRGIARKYCRDKADVDDILQETFVKVFLNISKYTGKGSFEGWIYRIAMNTTLSVYRKKKYTPVPENLDLLPEYKIRCDQTLSEISAKGIQKVISGLPEGYKRVFTLFNNGYSHKEIAEILNISEGTSKSQYHHARKALQYMVTV